MSRSRKKKPGESMTDEELRKYVIMLIIFSTILVLTAVAVISSKMRAPQEEPVVETLREQSRDTLPIPVIEPDTKEYFHDFESSILEQDTVPEITQLMEQYFLSISECDMETFMHLFTSEDTGQTELFQTRFETQKSYIESYTNISCYTTAGLTSDAYAAYVYYDTKYIGVETPAPALVQIYAMKCDDGQYRIYDGEISGELELYLEQLSMNEDVRLLISQVDRQMAEAVAADPALEKRIVYLKEGPEYMKDDTSLPAITEAAN